MEVGTLTAGAVNHFPPVLLAEDDPNEVFLLRRAFADAGILNPLAVARNGKEAVDYLKAEGEYSDRIDYPAPCLLLLDLKMPGMNGFDVLAWIRRQPLLDLTLPVVVLTDSYTNADMEKALALGAKGLFVNPFEHQDKVKLLQDLKELYLATTWILEEASRRRVAPNIPFHVFLTPTAESRN